MFERTRDFVAKYQDSLLFGGAFELAALGEAAFAYGLEKTGEMRAQIDFPPEVYSGILTAFGVGAVLTSL